jgi:phosphoglycolate phosphatase-like HAD superfamily hydrolase
MANALLLDLAALVKEQKEVGFYWTENIRNVYGIYLDDIKTSDMDGTVQEILYRKLGEHGITRMEIDSKMENFITELFSAYYNVAGHDNMSLTDGAKEAIALTGSKEFITGIATPIPERLAQNMMERAKMDLVAFKFTEYGAFNKDANALLTAALASAKSQGAEPDSDGIFVSSSPFMLASARALRIRTVAVTNGQESRFEGLDLNAKIRSLKDLRKGIQQATR